MVVTYFCLGLRVIKWVGARNEERPVGELLRLHLNFPLAANKGASEEGGNSIRSGRCLIYNVEEQSIGVRAGALGGSIDL